TNQVSYIFIDICVQTNHHEHRRLSILKHLKRVPKLTHARSKSKKKKLVNTSNGSYSRRIRASRTHFGMVVGSSPTEPTFLFIPTYCIPKPRIDFIPGVPKI